jgi:hypothetical protein
MPRGDFTHSVMVRVIDVDRLCARARVAELDDTNGVGFRFRNGHPSLDLLVADDGLHNFD